MSTSPAIRMWNTYTYGTDTSAFIVLGTAILNNFQNDDLLFVLAREMGHCRAGHALWKTVARFLVGDDSVRKGLLSGGVLNAISFSPTKWVQDAVDMPLMAWSRQADITADRAGAARHRRRSPRSPRDSGMVHPFRQAPQASQHRGVDEAGRGERRSDDALLRNDDHFLDVHHAAFAAARAVGPRTRADALEPEHSAGSQAPHASAPAARIGPDGCGAWRPASSGSSGSRPGARTSAAAVRLRPRSLQQVPDRDAHPAFRLARQTVAERPLSKMPEHLYAAAKVCFSGTGSVRCGNKSNCTAGVSLRTGKTGRPPAVRIATSKAGCRARAFECKCKSALQAAGSSSRA